MPLPHLDRSEAGWALNTHHSHVRKPRDAELTLEVERLVHKKRIHLQTPVRQGRGLDHMMPWFLNPRYCRASGAALERAGVRVDGVLPGGKTGVYNHADGIADKLVRIPRAPQTHYHSLCPQFLTRCRRRACVNPWRPRTQTLNPNP